VLGTNGIDEDILRFGWPGTIGTGQTTPPGRRLRTRWTTTTASLLAVTYIRILNRSVQAISQLCPQLSYVRFRAVPPSTFSQWWIRRSRSKVTTDSTCILRATG
jgi:hypothetical protein